MEKSIQKEVAQILINHGCFQIKPKEPFTYASGLKGPVYCDNRQILSYPEQRTRLAELCIQKIEESGVNFHSIAGLATAGIPLATLIAHFMQKPLIYIRSKPKGHGKGNQVEGQFEEGQKIILIEDLVNQGKSLGDALVGAKNAGLIPEACFSIVDYQMANAKKILNDHQLSLFSLTDFETLLQVALEGRVIRAGEEEIVRRWQSDPENWSLN